MQILVRIIDSDKKSIQNCKNLNNIYIDAHIGNALSPDIKGDEDIVCFNLILHHLIGATEKETRELQKKTIRLWRDRVQYIFINEYIYDSYVVSHMMICGIVTIHIPHMCISLSSFPSLSHRMFLALL